MSSRVSSRLQDEEKWGAEPARVTRRSGSGSLKEEAKRERLSNELEQAKRSINRVEAELQDEVDIDEQEDDEEDEQDEGVVASLRSRGGQAKREAERQVSRLKGKGSAALRDANIRAEGLLQQAKTKGTEAQVRGRQLARDAQDKGAELLDDAEEAAENVRSSVRSGRLSSKLDEGVSRARRGIEEAKQTLRGKKEQLKQSLRSSRDEDEDEDEGEEGTDWKATLAAKGGELLHTVTDAADSLRHRLVDAAPGIQSTLKRGLDVAREKLAAVDLQDDDMPSSSGSSSEEEEEEEDEDQSEDEEEEDEQEEDDSIAARIRSRAQQAARSGKQAAREVATRGRRALDEAADTAQEEGESLSSQVGEVLSHGKEVLDEGLMSEQAERAAGRISRTAKELAERVYEQGEQLVRQVRQATAEFDFDGAKDKASEQAENLKGRASGRLSGASARLREGAHQLRDEVNAHIPREAVDKLSDATSRVSRSAASLKARAREALHEVEEDLSLSDAAFTRAAGRGLEKFDRIVARDNNMRLPMLVIGLIFALWLGASVYQFVNPTPVEPTPPASMLDAAKLAMHDLKTTGIEGLQNLQDRGQHIVDRLQGKQAPPTWSDTLGGWRDSLLALGNKPAPFDLAQARDGIRQARDAVEEAGYSAKHMLENGVDYTREHIRRGAEQVSDDLHYQREHAGEYAQAARDAALRARQKATNKAEDLNLIPKQSLSGRMWAWLTGAETVQEQAARKANELRGRMDSGLDYLKAKTQPTLLDRIRARLPGHSGSPMLEKLKGTIPGLDIDPKATAEEYYAKALEKGYELKDGAYHLTHRSLADRIRAHLPGHHDTVLERVQRNVPGLEDLRGTAQDYYAAALSKGYELKDGAYRLTHRSLADRLRSYWPFHHETLLEKAQRNVKHLDASLPAQEYYNRALALGYELKDGAYQLVHPTLMDRFKAHLPGHSGSLMLEKLKGSITGLDIDPKATAEEYYAKALEKGYEIKDGAYQLTHRSLADRIRAHLPGHRKSILERVQRTVPDLDPNMSARDYYAAALAKGYELKDGAYRLTHRSLADRLKSYWPFHHETLLEKAERNIPNLDVRGTAQEYYDRAVAAGYDLRDGAYELVRPTLMDRLKAHLPGHSGSPLLEKLKGTIPGLDVDPKATAVEYYAKALEKGYELKDGAYQLTHRSLADRIRAHLPGHHATLLEKLKNSIPELQLSPSATAEEYLAKALEKGYELQDGAYKLTRRSLADRLRAHLVPGYDSLSDRIQRNIPNLDVSGTARDYYDRARAAGYELRNGAYQLANHAKQGIPEAVAESRANLHAMRTTETIPPQQDLPHVVSQPIPVQGVPLSEVQAETAHAEPLPDPLGHATPMGHIPSGEPVHRQTLAQSIKQGVKDAAANIRAHLPGQHHAAPHADVHPNVAERLRAQLPTEHDIHHLRKGAAYAGHRAVHGAEQMGHRVEEGLNYAGHRVQEGAEQAYHRAQEGAEHAYHRAGEAADYVQDNVHRRF